MSNNMIRVDSNNHWICVDSSNHWVRVGSNKICRIGHPCNESREKKTVGQHFYTGAPASVSPNAANNVWIVPKPQATFFRRRHQPSRPPLAKIRPGRPAPAMGPGTPRRLKSNSASSIWPAAEKC